MRQARAATGNCQPHPQSLNWQHTEPTGESMSPNDAKQWLEQQGLTMPAFLLNALMDTVESIEPCLESAGYPDSVATLIKAHLLTLLALGQAVRYMASASSPSGASISYRFEDGRRAFTNTLGLLRSLDTSGCTDGLIPDIDDGPRAGLWVAKSSCYTKGRCR